jgi:hypothetical protein
MVYIETPSVKLTKRPSMAPSVESKISRECISVKVETEVYQLAESHSYHEGLRLSYAAIVSFTDSAGILSYFSMIPCDLAFFRCNHSSASVLSPGTAKRVTA